MGSTCADAEGQVDDDNDDDQRLGGRLPAPVQSAAHNFAVSESLLCIAAGGGMPLDSDDIDLRLAALSSACVFALAIRAFSSS